MEAGGHYWRNLAYFLNKGGVWFCLVNPFTAKRLREGKDINRAKSEMRDASVMALAINPPLNFLTNLKSMIGFMISFPCLCLATSKSMLLSSITLQSMTDFFPNPEY